jgi:predicted phosphodiesterase
MKPEDLSKLSASPPTQAEKKLSKLEDEKKALQAKLKQKADYAKELEKSLQDARRAKRAPIPKTTPRKRKKEDWVRVIISDTHGSKIDPGAFAAVLADIKRLDPDEIIHLGDSIDCGGFLAEHHTLGFVAETGYTYEDDVTMANQQFDELQKAAPKAKFHLLEGNHERRVETYCVTKALRNGADAEFLRSLISPHTLLQIKERGIHYYRECDKHRGATVPGWLRLGKCWFVHGISTAKHAAATTLDRAGGNVVFGHTHRIDSAHAELPNVGPIAAWNPGCLCIKQPLWRHTSPTGWGNGYAVQIVAKSGEFLHLNVPIVEGKSLLLPLFHTARKTA